MHFYTETETGTIEPRHFVKMAKDPSRTRPSRITDAKKAAKNDDEIWLPSVTTILNILDKPALLNWEVDQHLDQAYRMAKEGQSLEGYSWKQEVKARTADEMDKAPKAGTDIHKILEDYFKDGITPADPVHQKICFNVSDLLLKYTAIPSSECMHEQYFVSGLDYAGCADLIVPGKANPELDDRNMGFVIDYKSKLTADKFKHRRQLAAYGKAILGNDFRAVNIFICLETGDVDWYEHDAGEIEDGYQDFLDCMSIYHRNTYKP